MSTKKRDKPDISESTSEFEHVSKRDKTNEEANEDSFDCELLRSNIDLTIFQIQQLKDISTKLLNSHKEGNANPGETSSTIKQGYMTFLKLKKHYRDAHLSTEQLKEYALTKHNEQLGSEKSSFVQLGYEKAQLLGQIDVFNSFRVMENRSDIISIEALKSEAPEEFAIQEGDDEYEITKKQLDYELDKRMKVTSLYNELKEKRKNAQSLVDRYTRLYKDLESRLKEFGNLSRRVSDEFVKINSEIKE